MIVDRSLKESKSIEIDLNGPEGNAYVLLAYVDILGRQLGWNRKARELVRETMMLSNYDNLIEIFDYHFGEHVILYK